MTTDRELLELAALAAGYDIYAAWSALGAFDGFRLGSLAGATWSPLEDDGDALRLAVKLNISISRPVDGDSKEHWGTYAEGPDQGQRPKVFDHGDPYAATRRAITQAAAEIGRAIRARSEQESKDV